MTHHTYNLSTFSVSFDEKNGSPTARVEKVRAEFRAEAYKLLEKMKSEGKLDLYT